MATDDPEPLAAPKTSGKTCGQQPAFGGRYENLAFKERTQPVQSTVFYVLFINNTTLLAVAIGK